MPDAFDEFELKEKTIMAWQKVDGVGEISVTRRGTYTVKQSHHLYYTPRGGVIEYIGNFSDPKKRARKHFNEEAM